MSINRSLLETNVMALDEGAQLIKVLQANQYTDGLKPAFQSTIGAHFRHVLEHYRCLLSQIPTGTICYDKRERDQMLECDAAYALQTIEGLVITLGELDDQAYDASYVLEDQQCSEPVATTLQRELLFLQSHTVHHYAIIGAMTRAFGNHPEDDFGVAIATRAHQKCTVNDTTIGDTPTCAQ